MGNKDLEELTENYNSIVKANNDLKYMDEAYYDSWRTGMLVTDDNKVGAAIVSRHVESGIRNIREDEYNGVVVFDKDKILKEANLEKWYFQDSTFDGFNKKELQIVSIVSAKQLDKGYEVQYKTADEKIHTIKS